MGTSSIYNGPKDHSSLLPDGFEEEYVNEADKEQKKQEVLAPWQAAKTSMSQFINGSHSNRGRTLRSYTKALGGSNNAARTARTGIKSAVNLGRLLSGISAEGIENTLQKLKISFRGRSVEELFSELVNILVPEANAKDDIVARKAAVEALSQLYEFIEENGMELKALDFLDETLFNKVMSTFVSSYIFERLLNDLSSRFEKYASEVSVAISKEEEVKEYIYQNTDIRLSEIDFKSINYSQSSIEDVLENIYRECYEVLEDYL